MSVENLLVRFWNRSRKKSGEQVSGFRLGEEETLIGNVRKPCIFDLRAPAHTFICGRTGSGKSTALHTIKAGSVHARVPSMSIEFHQHETDRFLGIRAAAKATDDVLLFEPWSDPVLGWNPLEAGGQSSYRVVQELVGIFHRRLWPDAWGPRLEELLRMTLLALAEAKLTLLEATTFISNPVFRRAVLQKIGLAEVREFWTLRFERLSPSQRSLISETVLNKLSVFHDPAVKYVVGQERSTLDFDRAVRTRQTIIANLSAGSLGGNNYLLAALLIAKLKSAVYRRPPNAPPYSIFLDEFQEMFALDALDDYLRSFRKFGCPVYLATQHLQLPAEIKAAIFGNCSRFLCFGSSATDAAFLSREFGGPESSLIADFLPELPTGQAIAKVRGCPATLLRVTPPSVTPTPQLVEEGRACCLRLGSTRAEIDEAIRKRMVRFSSTESRAHERPTSVPTDSSGETELPEGYGDS